MKNITDIDVTSSALLISYKDDLNSDSFIRIENSSLNISESSILDSFNNMVKSKIDDLPKTKAMVKYVNLLDGTFSISGNFYPLRTKKITDLTTDQKVVSDALYAFILSYTGNTLVSLEGEIGMHKVKINDVLYDGQAYLDMNTASGSVLTNAILLVIDIFNS